MTIAGPNDRSITQWRSERNINPGLIPGDTGHRTVRGSRALNLRLDLHTRATLEGHNLDLFIGTQTLRWQSNGDLDRLLARGGAIGDGLQIFGDQAERAERADTPHEPGRTDKHAENDHRGKEPQDKPWNSTTRTVELIHPGDEWS